jgi:hypothetical protein
LNPCVTFVLCVAAPRCADNTFTHFPCRHSGHMVQRTWYPGAERSALEGQTTLLNLSGPRLSGYINTDALKVHVPCRK